MLGREMNSFALNTCKKDHCVKRGQEILSKNIFYRTTLVVEIILYNILFATS